MVDLLDSLAHIDLGQSLLSIAVVIGFLLTMAVVFRSIEIPIRIYLDRRKKMDEAVSIEQEKGNGF